MFTCPGFSGGQYTHGDEQYQYTNGDATIVKRRLRRKGTADTSSSTDDLFHSSSAKSSALNIQGASGNSSSSLLSSSVPSSPPVQFGGRTASGRTHGSISPLALNDGDSGIQARSLLVR